MNENEKKNKDENKKEEIKTTTIQEPTPQKGKTWLQKTIFFLISASIITFLYFTNAITTPDNSTLVIYLTVSFMINAVIIIILFVTHIGDDVIQRYKRKIKYKTGNFVNTLHVTKSGVIMELFQKRDHETGTFKINTKSHITNPSLMYNFKDIPTYLHREGTPDPLNVWEDKIAGDLSTSEMDIAMNSKGAFDVKEWLEQNKQIILISCGLMVLCAAAAGYFGYEAYEMLRDGTYKKAASIACNNLPDFTSIPKTPLG